MTFSANKKGLAPNADKKIIGRPQTPSDMTTKELFEEYTSLSTHSTGHRVKDKYTQSHSPYGFADELKEIQIEIV